MTMPTIAGGKHSGKVYFNYSNRCVPETGARGTPGRRGMKGTPGTKGASGIPARLPCEPLQDLKKYCPEKCPQGPQGSPGQKVGLYGVNKMEVFRDLSAKKAKRA